MKHDFLRNTFPWMLLCLLSPAWLMGEIARIQPQAMHEQILPPQAVETLQKEAPLQNLAWENESTLWMLSKSTLWRWQTQKKSLQKIYLGTKEGNLDNLLLFGDTYFITTSRSLFIVHAAPLQVKKVKIDKTATSSFSQYPEMAFLLTQKAIYQINVNPDQVKLLHKITFATENPIYEPDTQALFFTEGDKVCRFDFPSGRKKILRTFSSMGDVQKLQLQNKQLVAQVDQVFYHLTLEGDVLQTIPVFGDKKIVAQNLQPKAHTFLFTDHVVEKITFDPLTQHYYQMPAISEGPIAHLVSQDRALALLQDGMPRIFQLSTPQ